DWRRSHCDAQSRASRRRARRRPAASCAIDHIASVLPYDSYVQAETMLRTLQVGGERVAAMRGSARHNEIVANLRRTQAEADILCFQ
ncbi:MAG: hypothetical protein AAFT19_04495, partial [Pseudomonadota bacterium]